MTNKKQINGKFNNSGSADENKKTTQQFLPLPEADIYGLLHPAQAPHYFFVWFQSLYLPSTV
jgi:hypothetical protein